MALFSILFRYKDKNSPDKLGVYPEKFPTQAFPERRYLWTSRVLVIFSVLSFCLTILLTSVLYLLLPLQRSTPSLYHFNPYFYTLDKVHPLKEDIKFMEILTQKYLADYVQMRHSVPKSTADLFYRWDKNSLFYWYSSSVVYYRFINSIDRNQFKRFIRLQMKRIVEIDEISHLSGNLWRVHFKTLTTTKNMPEPNIIYCRAYVHVVYTEMTGYEDLEKTDRQKQNYTANPFGFTVTDYALAYAGTPQKSDTAMQTAKKVFDNLEDVVR